MPGLGFLAALLGRWGFSSDAAKRLAPVAAILLLLALYGVLRIGFQAWDWWDDRQAVQADRDAGNAEFRKRQIGAERGAGAAKGKRDRADAENQNKLEGRIGEANRNGTTAADDVWNGGLWDQPAR